MGGGSSPKPRRSRGHQQIDHGDIKNRCSTPKTSDTSAKATATTFRSATSRSPVKKSDGCFTGTFELWPAEKEVDGEEVEVLGEPAVVAKEDPLVHGPLLLRFNEQPPVSERFFPEHRDGRSYCVIGPLLSHNSCDLLCRLTEAHTDWAEQLDSVDQKPEHQHCILDLGKNKTDPQLLPFVEHLSETVILPRLLAWKEGAAEVFNSNYADPNPCATASSVSPSTSSRQRIGKNHGGNSKRAKLKMHWAFLRRYSAETRLDFPVHRDKSSFTVNVLLCDDYEGAELYMLPDSPRTLTSSACKSFGNSSPKNTSGGEDIVAAPVQSDHAARQDEGIGELRRMRKLVKLSEGTKVDVVNKRLRGR